MLNHVLPFSESLQFLSAEQRTVYNALISQTRAVDAGASEWAAADEHQVGEPGSLGDIPLYVIHAEATFPTWVYGDDIEDWQRRDRKLYKAIQSLSTCGQLQIIAGADHGSLILAPEHRRFLVQAIQSILDDSTAS